MIAVGTHLGPYVISARLGSGGMGEVFRARDQRLGREVAIKVLPEKMAHDREALERFEREARALAALSHPNILIIYDFNVDQDMAFAVTELLEGETLRALIERGAVTLERALEIGIAISEGLAAAHSRGVIHRDLKPENIFITKDNVIKILDFGLARLDQNHNKPAGDQDLVSTMWSDTKPGTIMGTIPYMSPEQVRGNHVDARTDIFSFGCVLYEMLSGSNPFYSGSMVETMASILKDQPPELAKSNSKVLPEVDPIISQCLAKDPEQRYQSARDVTTALKRLQSGSWITSTGKDSGRDSQRDSQKDSNKEINNSLARRNTTRKLRKLIDSLAILPFTNESQHPDAEYLTDGITESLINIVSQLPKLRVMARSTVFRYKNKSIDPLTIGEELKVRAVLTGRVIQRGDTLNIQAELVDVSDGAQVWGAHYLRKFSDIFELQEEIADQISEQLKIKLSGEEKKRLAKRSTKNPEAYQLYLKGRHFWNKRTPDMIKKGIEYFQQAIDIDLNFALAYAGLADSYNVLGTGEVMPPRELFPKAKAAAMRAVELDECLAEAHTSLAMVKHRFDHDWQGAERGFRRALELNPNYATAHHWYSTYLQTLGRFDEAMAQVKKAQELDPLSLIINAAVGLAFHYSRQPDLAIAQFLRTLEMDANFAPAYLDLMWAYIQKDMIKEAITHGQRGIALLGDIAFATKIGHGFAESGPQGALRRMMEHAKEQAQFRYVSPYRVAINYILLNEPDQAFEWLQKAYEERSNGMVFLKIDPIMDKVRDDARFKELLLRVGLPV